MDSAHDFLTNKDKLFNKYINISQGNWLRLMIWSFQGLIGLPNICGSINGMHIPLVDLPSKRVTFVQSDYFNWKKIHNIVLQGVCDAYKYFWNTCVRELGGVHEGG